MATSSLATIKLVWYRRPWVLVTFVVVVVVAISIITDLPRPLAKSEDATSQNASLKQINADIAPCAFSVSEAFRFYTDSVTGNLTPARLKIVNAYLLNDQTACSFASSGMSDLTNNLQISTTAAGTKIYNMETVLVTWMDSDANKAIVDIAYLIKHPGDRKTIADLRLQEQYLAKDREIAMGYLNAAQNILGSANHLNNLNLPVLGPLPGV